MFSRFKGFLVVPSIIILTLLFVWLSWQPSPPAGRFIKYKDFFTVNEQNNTVTVRMVQPNPDAQGTVSAVDRDLSLSELEALIKGNPNLILKFDIELDQLVITEFDLVVVGEQKIKLGVAGDYLGIYKQMADGTESLEKVVQIKINELPLEWQTVLLEGKMIFDSETALLEALDSLDEYQLR
ncbi:MAG: hypothetical protein WDA53_08480 [Bacillota bacterium]